MNPPLKLLVDMDFGWNMDVIYMDYNATTPIDSEVSNVIMESLESDWGNPSSSHIIGQKAKNTIHSAKKRIAQGIGSVDPEEIIITSGGTESNHLVIHSAMKSFEVWSKKNSSESGIKPHIITTNIEHPAIDLPLRKLEAEEQIELTIVDVVNGKVRLEDITEQIKANTCLITVMMANNETGIIQDIASIGKGLEFVNVKRIKNGDLEILFHTDAAQTIGKIPVDVKSLRVHFLTIVGHKFYGPRIGALFCSKIVPQLYPMFIGGGQEDGRRAGTENTPMIAGLGKAVELATQDLEQDMERLRSLRRMLVERLKHSLGSNVEDNFATTSEDERLPNTLSVSFKNVTGIELIANCEMPGLAASTQAACHSKRKMGSSILVRSGIDMEKAKGTLRLSLGRQSNEEEINQVVKLLTDSYQSLCMK